MDLSEFVPVPTSEELQQAHEEYTKTVRNNYSITIDAIANTLPKCNVGEVATAVAGWLKSVNPRHPPKDLEQIIKAEWTAIGEFRARSLNTLIGADRPAILQLFGLFRLKLGPVGAAKALHVLAPRFFPMWDNPIASGYGVGTEAPGYFLFMFLTKHQVLNLPKNPALLKILDEYNYRRYTLGKPDQYAKRACGWWRWAESIYAWAVRRLRRS